MRKKTPFYKTTKGIIAIVGISVGVILLISMGNILGSSDSFNGKNAKLENLTIVPDNENIKINGQIIFKNDEDFTSLSADVKLKDGCNTPGTVVKNWNKVQKDQWYAFETTIPNNHKFSSVELVDFKLNNETIHTWVNK